MMNFLKLGMLAQASVFALTSSASPLTTYHEPRSNPFVIYQFPDPTWVENLAFRSNELLCDIGTQLPKRSRSAGKTKTSEDIFQVIASNFTLPLNIASGTSSIWTVDLTEYHEHTNTGAKIHEVGLIGDAGLLNGLATLNAEQGVVVAADSIGGALYAILVTTGAYAILMQGPEFESTGVLDVNGVQVLPKDEEDVCVYFTNTGQGTFNRVPISLSSLSNTSTVEVLATGITCDDFALDTQTGLAYLADGVKSNIISVPLGGGKALNVTAPDERSFANTIFQPTNVHVARDSTGEQLSNLTYITTAGGLESPVSGTYGPGGQVLGYYLS